MQQRRSPNTIRGEIAGWQRITEYFQVEGTSAGHLGKMTFQSRAGFEVESNFEVGSGCSGLYPVMFFIPLRTEIMKHLWATCSKVWPSSLWIPFPNIYSERPPSQLEPCFVWCLPTQKPLPPCLGSHHWFMWCQDSTTSQTESCGNFLNLYGGCENPLNWKTTKSPATGSDCKIRLLVVEEYSPVKSSSFQRGVENIRRRKKVQQKCHMKEKALIRCSLYQCKQKNHFYYYRAHSYMLRAVWSRPACCITYAKEPHCKTGIFVYIHVFTSLTCAVELQFDKVIRTSQKSIANCLKHYLCPKLPDPMNLLLYSSAVMLVNQSLCS